MKLGLMDENPEYDLTKKEIEEDGLEDTYIRINTVWHLQMWILS